jgi:uncharacterized Ntn-hydrolase superfamily protein
MTFCVVARDPEAGTYGIALATSPLAVASRCPFIRVGVGAVSTQAYTDPSLGPLALNFLEEGMTPAQALVELGKHDPKYAWRQVGIVDRQGRAAVHTGAKCEVGFTGAITGENYLVMGNYLLNDQVVPAMDRAWRASAGKAIEDRLMETAIAARDAGGDMAGHRSSGILVHDADGYARTDLRIDFAPRRGGLPDAVDQLKTALDAWKPMIPYFKARPKTPDMPGWMDWLKAQGTPYRD